ncbi:MAG TPA: TonB-dependent receptor, partial [Kofleriaceae bacterium]|nr:TonB-dependent receptor [Kofleriaceae bacterium]
MTLPCSTRAILVFLLATASAPVLAQTTAAPATELASEGDIADIVVTAQRRVERLIDVPVSVVATSGETLEDLNLTASTDLQFVTPGFALGDANTPRGAGFRIRGIGTNVFADGIEQSVGTVVDGVPLARAGQGLADLTDVERVEVLRGPQGLLFGRNASAGVLNIVTRKPGNELELNANASYGSDDEIKLSGGVSAPLGAGLSARLSGYINRNNGFVTNVRTGEKLNNRNEYGFRGTLRYEPNENLEILLRGDWSNRRNRCCVWTVRQFASAATDPRPGTVFLRQLTGPLASGPEALENNGSAPYYNRSKNRGGSAEINYLLGDYTLTSITAYRKWNQVDNNDADLSPINVLDRNMGANNLEQTTQELRLTSPSDGFVEFVAGLFYFDSKNVAPSSQVGRFANGLALAAAGGINVPLAPGLVLPATQLFGRDTLQIIDTRDYAVFGQATINITDRLALIAGGRVTDTKVGVDYARTGSP